MTCLTAPQSRQADLIWAVCWAVRADTDTGYGQFSVISRFDFSIGMIQIDWQRRVLRADDKEWTDEKIYEINGTNRFFLCCSFLVVILSLEHKSKVKNIGCFSHVFSLFRPFFLLQILALISYFSSKTFFAFSRDSTKY